MLGVTRVAAYCHRRTPEHSLYCLPPLSVSATSRSAVESSAIHLYILLQQQGIVNDFFVWIGLVSDENRPEMMYNKTGTYVAMTQILLPFMVLPLYSVMKTISPSLMRAGKSLGGTPFVAFWKVYFPLTIPGIGAGCLLVFILAIGYYITPALVGGASGTLISNQIAFHMKSTLDWSFASAMGLMLLTGVLAIYWVYNKLVGVDNIKLG